MSNLPKKKRVVYEKEFTLQHVLQNLQGYRLATGSVSAQQEREYRQLYGDDEGRLYGALITGAGKLPSTTKVTSKPGDVCGGGDRKRTRKRRRKRRKNLSVTDKVQQGEIESMSGQELEEPPAHEAASIDVDTFSNLVAACYDSSDSNSNNELDSSRGAKLKEHYHIPTEIQGMFEENELEISESVEKVDKDKKLPLNFDGGETLGFFQSADSSSSDDGIESSSYTGSSHKGIMKGKLPRKWDGKKAQWVYGASKLSSYTCWKCSNVGHLPQDCRISVGDGTTARPCKEDKIPQSLQSLYATCREIKRKKGQRCAECGLHSNLAYCLDCRSVHCDGKGHLASHLLAHPSHHLLYSFKLERLLKCCKPTCEVMNVYELLMCSHCLGKAFSQHYSMLNAVWSGAGLKKIPNALCCEEHFQWHRMNCSNVEDDHFIDKQKLHSQSNMDGLLSEFFF